MLAISCMALVILSMRSSRAISLLMGSLPSGSCRGWFQGPGWLVSVSGSTRGRQVGESFALAFPPPVFLLVCHAAQWLLARGDDGHGGAYLFDFLARTKPH